jgi:hypothetical protein
MSAEIISNARTLFPNEDVSPKEKESKAWLMQFAQAAFNSYGDTPFGSIGYRSRDKYEWIKTYAQGRQSIERYKRVLTPDQDPNNNTLVVDWSVLPIIPKFRRTALGLLEKQNYDIQIDPVDPFAQSEKDMLVAEMKAKAILREEFKKQGRPDLAESAAIMANPGEPDDLDGIEVAELGMRHKTSMEAELVVELVFDQNDYEGQRRQQLQDQFDYGVAIFKDYEQDGLVGFRRVDPRRFLSNFCTYPDFRDLRYAGEVLEVPVAQLIQMSNGELTNEDIEFIYKYANANQWRGNMPVGNAYYGTYNDFWNKGKVQVLDLEIYSTDNLVREERVDRRGNVVFGRAGFEDTNNKKQKFKRKQVVGVYRVKWIVGTNICFDYGKQWNVKRDPINIARAKPSFHIGAVDFFDMKTFSRMEAIIPYADSIQLAYYRLQHELNTAVPRGFNINLAALEEVSLSGGGKAMSPSDIIDLYLQRGVLVSRSVAADGRQVPPAINQLEGGVGNAIAEYWNMINNNLDMIRQTLGLNELTDGSTPNPKFLTTVAQLAASGTNNALSDISYSDRALAQSLSEAIIIRVQDVIKRGGGEAYENSLGLGTVELLKRSQEISKYTYGIAIVDKPTAEEKAKLDELVKVALQSGQVNIDDVIRLNNIQNIKQAELFLAYKVKKNNEKKQQEAMQAQQMNGQIQQQSAMVAEQAKQQTIQMEYQMKSELEKVKADMEARLIELRGQFDLERERISATGRVESSFVQAKERDAANIRDNKTKLMQDGKMEDMGEIDVPAELESRVAPETAGGQQLNIQEPSGFSFLGNANQQSPAAQGANMMQQGMNEQMNAMNPMQEEQGMMEEMEGAEVEQGEPMSEEQQQMQDMLAFQNQGQA